LINRLKRRTNSEATPNDIDERFEMVIKMGNIKSLLSLLVGFIMAYLLGIASFIAIYYKDMLGLDSFTSMGLIALFAGVPLGSSLGIFITKMFLFRTGKFSVLCLFTSLVFGVLAGELFWWLFNLMVPRLATPSVFLLVPLYALIGYNAMEMLLGIIGTDPIIVLETVAENRVRPALYRTS